MDEEIIEQLQVLADDVVNGIDFFVPVIGNLLFTKDGSELYSNFRSFIDKHNNDCFHAQKRSIKIHESVLEFLVNGNFKLILTTSPFDVLDRALSERGVSVKTYYHRWGQQDSTNEIQRKDGEWSQKDCLENGTIGKEDTLIYHLLGGYTTKMPNKNKTKIRAPTYTGPLVNGWSPKYCENTPKPSTPISAPLSAATSLASSSSASDFMLVPPFTLGTISVHVSPMPYDHWVI